MSVVPSPSQSGSDSGASDAALSGSYADTAVDSVELVLVAGDA